MVVQGNDKNGNNSIRQEGERRESEEVEEMGGVSQEGGGTAGDTLTAEVCKLNLSLRDLGLFVCYLVSFTPRVMMNTAIS